MCVCSLTPSEWQECPEYTPSVQNECYFSRNFTQIWKTYCVQLRSNTHTDNITYDEQCFSVENIGTHKHAHYFVFCVLNNDLFKIISSVTSLRPYDLWLIPMPCVYNSSSINLGRCVICK